MDRAVEQTMKLLTQIKSYQAEKTALKHSLFFAPGQSNIPVFHAWNVCALSPNNTLAPSWLTIGQPTALS